MADRHVYSKKELEVYFDRICLPEPERIYDVTGMSNDDKIDFLQLLQKHHVVKVPYCMEVDFFFHLILLSLGFDVYMCGSRIYKSAKGGFGGWTHVVNLVTIAGTKWLCDAMDLHDPCLFFTEKSRPKSSRRNIDSSTNQSDRTSTEHKRIVIESMNFEPCLDRQTFFTHKVAAVRFTTANEKNGTRGPGSPLEAHMTGEIDGAITLNHDVLKWRRNGKKVVEFPLKSETDRLEALCMYFGITFSDEDIEAIKGTAAMIGCTAMDNP
ncbi:uncharacterized protein MYCFIDRAFT_195573 [Pseudocercospora fijiensis CIRAD86]|uniref:Uncharacterized protein n=1 Tax=Pseudocercospora fijiensis (strain CIRAD86) TaxID=383855 RepID=M3B5C4_PSEFD|nr:uncharacterized protein MYCFIDRAFT_195573 [Pseudocercospora fijiensis CIRAD86]EME84563.1 hypothetical protein MYCFIDRAFT_195573 [Pseudocercospora fijiensis CIRAD86]